MQNFKAKRNYQIESYIIEGDFSNNNDLSKRVEKKLEEKESPNQRNRPLFHFCEKAHTIHEYIEIGDMLYMKNAQSTLASNLPIKYMQYEIQENDSIYGIALKFNVSPESIKNLNFLSEHSHLFPGQIISISKPVSIQEIQLPTDFEKNEEIPLESLKDWLLVEEKEEEKKEISQDSTIEDMILRRKSSGNIGERLSFNLQRKATGKLEENKYEAYYCTIYGDIKGILTINDYFLMFDPLQESNLIKKDCSLNFQVCLEIKDIVEAFMMNLPNKYCDEKLYNEKTKNFNKDYFLEINVIRIGDKAIEKRYEERIHAMSIEKLPLATIFFKIYDFNFHVELNNNEKYVRASEIQKKISDKMKHAASINETCCEKEQSETSMTHIPFFDIIYENLFKTSAKKSIINYKSKPIIKNLKLFGVLPEESNEDAEFEEVPEYIPKLLEDSEILTNEHFLQILDYLPPTLKLRNWKLTYSNIKHGSSLNTLFYKCEESGPNILVIQDFKGWVFGGFCSCSWERSQKFYGNGENFLFSFKNTKKMNSFTWTGDNYHFQYSDSDGLVLGAGEHYGLYVKGDLLSGNSHWCSTFNNDILSSDIDFDIRFIEIWSCDEFVEF